MFEDILNYGRKVLDNRYSDVPFEILSRLSNPINQVYLKRELAEKGFSIQLPIEYESLDQTVKLMETAINDTEFVFYTVNYLAIRNPLMSNELFDFLKGC